jgi:hypothetical protein
VLASPSGGTLLVAGVTDYCLWTDGPVALTRVSCRRVSCFPGRDYFSVFQPSGEKWGEMVASQPNATLREW